MWETIGEGLWENLKEGAGAVGDYAAGLAADVFDAAVGRHIGYTINYQYGENAQILRDAGPINTLFGVQASIRNDLFSGALVSINAFIPISDNETLQNASNDFLTDLTGHNYRAEEDLMANLDKADELLTTLQNIKTNEVETARDEIRHAMVKLNSIKGFNTHVIDNINVDCFDFVFDEINAGISSILTTIAEKIDRIVNFQNSSTVNKILATSSTVSLRTTEGILNFAEHLEDAAAVNIALVGGWIFGNDFRNTLADYAAMDHVHDTFERIYRITNNYSYITSDSAVSDVCELAGETGGFILTELVANIILPGSATSAIPGIGGKIVITQGALVDAGLAAVSTYGSSTTNNLQQGVDFETSVLRGTLDGLKNGAIVFLVRGTMDNASLIEKVLNPNSTTTTNIAEPPTNVETIDSPLEVTGTRPGGSTTVETATPGTAGTAEAVPRVETIDSPLEVTGTRPGGSTTVETATPGTAGTVPRVETIDRPLEVTGTRPGGSTIVETATSGTAEVETASRELQSLGESLKEAETNLSRSYANGASEAELEQLAEIRDAASRAYAEAGGDPMPIRNAANSLEQSERNFVEAWRNGVSEAELGQLEETRDAARHVLDRLINENEAGVSNIAGETVPRVETIDSPLEVTGTRPGGSTTVETATPGTAGTASVEIASAGAASSTVNAGTAGISNSSVSGVTNTILNARNNNSINNEQIPNKTLEESLPRNDINNIVKPDYKTRTVRIPSNEINESTIDESTEPSSPSPSSNNYNTYSNSTVSDTNIQNNNVDQPVATETNQPVEVQPRNVIDLMPSEQQVEETETITQPIETIQPQPTSSQTNTSSNEGYTSQPQNGGTSSNYTNYASYTNYTNNNTSTGAVEPEEVKVEEFTEDVIKEGNKIDIPKSKIPITTTTQTTSNKGNSVIPVLAGLSAAAAAGVGAKAYIDRKNNNNNDDDYDEVKVQDWSDNNDINLEYTNQTPKEETLDFDDDYNYEVQEPEKYDARTHQELEDLQ